MKKIISMLAMTAVVAAFWACEDDPAPDNGVTITGIPASAQIENLGTLGPVTATIEAADGLASLVVTKGSASFATETYTGETSATYDFTYTATAADEDQLVTFTFTATDVDGDVATVVHVLGVGAAAAPIPNEVKTGLISANETWTNDRIYELAGRVIVTDGVTLTIEEGTIIKGREGSGSLASALLVGRGGKLNANGTAANPIIFTSILDNIKVGEKAGTNLDETDTGLWGGVLILGKATVSVAGGETQIEGIPADIVEGEYGGGATPVDNDNSGTIRYISIRHGGSLIGANNEINGLTLGGVGSGTTIEYVEVVGNKDDGIEFFGGTVNVTNALVWAQEDDAYDVDQAYSGTIDNVIYIAGPDSDHGMEIDGPEASVNGGFTIKNGSFKGLVGEYADFRSKAQGTVMDLYFFNYRKGDDFELDADGTDNTDTADPDDKRSNNPGVSDNFAGSGAGFSGALTITGLEFNSVVTDDGAAQTLAAIFADKWNRGPSEAPDVFDAADTRTSGDATAQAAANEATFIADNSMVTSATKTKGADKTKFAGWTLADIKGKLADF